MAHLFLLLAALLPCLLGPPAKLQAQAPVATAAALAEACQSFAVGGLIGARWLLLSGDVGPLGCPLSDEHAYVGANGRYQVFEHGQIGWSPDQGPQFVLAAYQEEQNLVVDWGETMPFNYDYFNVRWDKDGVNIGQQTLHDAQLGTRRTGGHWVIPNPSAGTYRIIVEGCDDGTIFTPSRCRQGFSQPVFVTYVPKDLTPQLELSASASAPSLAYCAVAPCPTVSYTILLSARNGVAAATLTATLPLGLTFVEGSAAGGALYDAAAHRLTFNAPVRPDAPLTLSYQARLNPGVPPGTLLETSLALTGAGAPRLRGVPVAVEQSDFSGALVLIYASSDNNLAGDILWMVEAAERGAANPGVVVLLLLDGPGVDDTYLVRLGPQAQRAPCPNRYADPSCGGRYTSGQDLWRWPTDNLGDRHTLASFVHAAALAYPAASRRVLALVGHGGGWSPPLLGGQPSGHGGQPGDDPLGGMLWDDHPGTSLSTPDLGAALREAMADLDRDAPARAPHRLDLLFLDACDMAMAEVAYEVRDSARALLASPNWKWAGFPYDRHLTSLDGDGPAIGRAWLRNEAAYMRQFPEEPFTYALLDLDAMPAIRDAANGLGMALMRPGGPLESEAGRELIDRAGQAADRYDSNQDGAITYEDQYVDLLSFAQALADTFRETDSTVVTAARALAQAVSAASVAELQGGRPWAFPGHEWAWHRGAGGLSIYLPLHRDDWRRRYYGLLQFTSGGAWQQLVSAWWRNAPAPANPACPSDCKLPPGLLTSDTRLYLPIVQR